MTEAIRVTGLTVSVASKLVLKDVSFSVEAGEVVAVMGPNGAGKSTLASALMGHPGYEIQAGSILVDGIDVTHAPTDERARAGLSLISQYPPEVPGLSVARLVTLARSARNLGLESVDAELEKEAQEISLDPALLRRWVNVDLSGGEKKKLESLIAGVVRSKLVVCDEVDSGLDIDALRQVAKRLARSNTEDGTALCMITHYPRLLREVVPHRVIILSAGRIARVGDASLAEELEAQGYAAYV